MKWELYQRHYPSALVSVTHTVALYTMLGTHHFPVVCLEIKGCILRKKRFLNCCVILCLDTAITTNLIEAAVHIFFAVIPNHGYLYPRGLCSCQGYVEIL